MATHYRAGEILYELIGNLKYQVQVITYTKISYPSNLADRDSVVVDWGDGTHPTYTPGKRHVGWQLPGCFTLWGSSADGR